MIVVAASSEHLLLSKTHSNTLFYAAAAEHAKLASTHDVIGKLLTPLSYIDSVY